MKEGWKFSELLRLHKTTIKKNFSWYSSLINCDYTHKFHRNLKANIMSN